VFPITSQKSYFLFKYNESLINSASPLVRAENKGVSLATKGWNKLRDSDKVYNKKIVYYITKLLDTTPWGEDSLRSIPSSSSLLRQLKRSTESPTDVSIKDQKELLVSQVEREFGDHKDNLIDIPVFYPSSIINQEDLQAQLTKTFDEGIRYHRKHMLITGFLVPLTLPFALVPVVPNIPGFYFAYRFYCNFKAYLGAQHLKELMQQNHLLFNASDELDSVFEKVKSKQLKINEGVIDEIVDEFDIENARSSFLKALKQERKEIHKSKTDV
jgi:hypothetical protein